MFTEIIMLKPNAEGLPARLGAAPIAFVELSGTDNFSHVVFSVPGLLQSESHV